jgi:hypothetical protein
VSQKDLAAFHPAHAAYVDTRNEASVISKQLTTLKEMGSLCGHHLQGRGPVHAERAADEPVDDVLLQLLGILRRVPRNRSARYKVRRTRTGRCGWFHRRFPWASNVWSSRRLNVVVHPTFDDWLAYFRRTLPATAGLADYERHIKYGPTREYWNDDVFEAYVNHQADAIYLAGLPDVPVAALIPRFPRGMVLSKCSDRNVFTARLW